MAEIRVDNGVVVCPGDCGLFVEVKSGKVSRVANVHGKIIDIESQRVVCKRYCPDDACAIVTQTGYEEKYFKSPFK